MHYEGLLKATPRFGRTLFSPPCRQKTRKDMLRASRKASLRMNALALMREPALKK